MSERPVYYSKDISAQLRSEITDLKSKMRALGFLSLSYVSYDAYEDKSHTLGYIDPTTGDIPYGKTLSLRSVSEDDELYLQPEVNDSSFKTELVKVFTPDGKYTEIRLHKVESDLKVPMYFHADKKLLKHIRSRVISGYEGISVCESDSLALRSVKNFIQVYSNAIKAAKRYYCRED